MAKKVFFLLILLQILIFGTGYFFLDPVLDKMIENTENEILNLNNKLKKARSAQADMSKIETRLREEQ